MQRADERGQTTTRPPRVVWWFLLIAVIALFANGLAVMVVSQTFSAMGGVSDYAAAVRSQDVSLARLYNLIVFPGATAAVVGYLWPVLAFAQRRQRGDAPLQLRRRLVGIPLVVALLGFAPWFLACLAFPAMTFYRFGHWSPELMSQQVLSPLVSGFLAATTTYLLVDWLMRARIVPRLLPRGLTQVPSAFALGVHARLLVFLLAVAFTPLFTLLGLVRAAVVRLDAGVPVERVISVLAHASNVAFVAYVLLGIGLTGVLARTLTRPLGQVVAALRRVQGGDLSADVQVTSNDEVGVLQDGVNTMIAGLRDKEHILQTFGRVVEPAVRDQLLRGDLRLGGELRTASVLFCDLRGFTGFAERTPPEQVVATLNQFFTAMTAWVRECGGFVDKFIGDAMLVVFGLFDHNGQAASAAAALHCALGMRERLAGLNAARQAAGQPPLAVAVSIHTGEVLSGTIGAADRHEYTVIGDTVNVAARLQQLCKEQGRDVLFSETTYELARAHGLVCAATLQDFVSLRGRSEPVRIFAVA